VPRLVRKFGYYVLSVAGGLGAALPALAQVGTIEASVVGEGGTPLPGVAVRVGGTALGALSGSDGVATIQSVPVGEHTVRAERIGYAPETRTAFVSAGEVARVSFTLVASPVRIEGIRVSVLRPHLQPELELEERQVREANPQDVGGVLRTVPGLDAVRRGGLGLDPVVRGLRDTQLGVYVDGMRTLPGGPGGMDTPISHVDPSAVQGMEVMKGPYALTWGAGNMSAIRVETNPLPVRGSAPVSGGGFLGYDTNLSAREAGLEVAGVGGPVGYTVSGAWRKSEDYDSGSGLEVPAEFTSGELRGRVGYFVTPRSTVTLSGWYQNQRGIDYPGRPLDAQWFDTFNGAVDWELNPHGSRLRSLQMMAYMYSVDHGMNNDEKPTALPNPNRVPPWPMDILTTSRVDMVGGRVAAEVTPAEDWTLEIGADGYAAGHDAASVVRNRSTQVVMMERLIWGDATLQSAGLFARVERPLGPVRAAGTVRVDHVRADADSASAFFLANATSDLVDVDKNLSGAVTFMLPLGGSWSVSAGAGSVARAPDANERYSDRAPSKKSQISAEFMGDPGLRPERSNQLDLGVEAAYPRWSASLNVFTQRIDDHITIEATTLPPQSAMSAPTVYRYVNGDASYRGAELASTIALASTLTMSSGLAYLWGEDLTLGEPALGVSPLNGNASLRWEPVTDRFLEASVRAFARQDRVSVTRGEIETPAYGTLDLQGGFRLPRGATLRFGVNNVFDSEYANHLNARNPFTSASVAEPGRVFFGRMSFQF
jgi:iron complex outermembrane receptor protein